MASANNNTTSLVTEEILPEDSSFVASLKQTITRLKNDLAKLQTKTTAENEGKLNLEQQPSGVMKDWKRVYTSQVEKYYEMQDMFRRKREKDELKIQQVQTKLDVTTEQLIAVKQQLQSALQDAKQLRENEKKLRQKHLYELDEVQDMLNREQELRKMDAENAAQTLQTLQQQHADQLSVMQDAHDIELGVATEEYNTKLKQKDQQIEQYRDHLDQTQRQLRTSVQQVETLQREKRSLRYLFRDARRLIRERVRNQIRKLLGKH
jgi:chromosome segregation ATPase